MGGVVPTTSPMPDVHAAAGKLWLALPSAPGMLCRTDGVCQALMALLHITKVPQLGFPPQHQLPPHMFSCENPALMGTSAAFALLQVPSPEGKHYPGSACLQGEDFTG